MNQSPPVRPPSSQARQLLAPLAACVFVLSVASSMHAASPRHHESFDFGWRFQTGDVVGAEQPGYNDSAWRSLDLPHDWSIEGPYDEKAPTGGSGGFLPTGLGWYRKTFVLPEAARGRQVGIQFDGIYQHSTVWINGHELGTRPYGYSTFSYDLTAFLNYEGKPNLIAVRVDNSQQPNSRWYSGSGIYRHTWLTITDSLFIPPSGVYVTTPEISPERASVRIRTLVRNSNLSKRHFEVRTQILDISGNPLPQKDDTKTPEKTQATSTEELSAGAEGSSDITLVVSSPRLWSPNTPELYRVRCEIIAEGAVIDATDTTFGLRSIVYDVDRGFLLNGTAVKMKGMCLHHDGGAVGAAVPEAVLERRLRLLKEMGCNAIRCSHNPMAPEFYDLCDRLGLLVMDEAFDEWTLRKPQIKFGYSDVFEAWFERDLISFIHRDRNHPSVIMWSSGNEIGEQEAAQGPDILRKIIDVFHREDPTRPVTAAMDNIFNEKGQAPVAFSGLLDVVGYNYVDRWGTRRETHYSDDREHFPTRKFIGTENTSARAIRGEYRFGPLLGGTWRPGLVSPGFGPTGALYTSDALRAASLWRFVATHDYVIGDFAWTGFDYLGESWWPYKLAASGPLDTCGFKKDTFFFYQSIWTKTPMLHLLPHWNWPDRVGKIVPVVAYTNSAVVELFLNGRSLGPKAREFPSQGSAGDWNSYAQTQIHASTSDLQLVWDVPYEPGQLKAVAYDRDGKVVAESSVSTAGEPVALELSIDRPSIAADARDVAHVTVRALDAKSVPVPLADNLISFEITGPAKLIGVDNGDPSNHESYQSNERALFHGMALALVRSTREAGHVCLTARSKGLREASVNIETGRPLQGSR